MNQQNTLPAKANSFEVRALAERSPLPLLYRKNTHQKEEPMKRARFQLRMFPNYHASAEAFSLRLALALLSVLLIASVCCPVGEADELWPAPQELERELSPPRTAAEWCRAGWAELLVGGDYDRARTAFQRCLTREEIPAAHFGLALSWLDEGDQQRAGQELLPLLNAVREPSWQIASALLVSQIVEHQGFLDRAITDRCRRLIERGTVSDPILWVVVERMLAAADCRTGEAERVWRASRGAGRIVDWAITGPYGKFPALSFYAAHPPEQQDFQFVLPHIISTSASPILPNGAVLIDHSTDQGTYYLASSFTLPASGQWFIVSEYPHSYRIELDGQHVVTIDRLLNPQPAIDLRKLDLPAGKHRITVKLLKYNDDDSFQLRLLPAFATAQHAVSASSIISGPFAEQPVHAERFVPDWLPATDTIATGADQRLDRLIAGILWSGFIGDQEITSSLREIGRKSYPNSARFLYWQGLVDIEAANNGAASLMARARETFERCQHLQPTFLPATLMLARIANSEDQFDTAILLTRQCLGQQPQHFEANRLLISLFRSRQWISEARQAFQQTIALAPEDPQLTEDFLHFCYNEDLMSDFHRSLRWIPSPVPNIDLLRYLLMAERMDELDVILTQLEQVFPGWPDLAALRIRAAIAAGDLGRARAAVWSALALSPRQPDLTALAARIEAQAGAVEPMLQLLRTWAKVDRSATNIRQFLNLRDWNNLFLEFPVDVPALIKAAESVNLTADELMVFDQGIVILDRDGTSVEKFFVLMRVLTQAGVEKNVERRELEGLDPIRVQVIKPDGKRFDAVNTGVAYLMPNLQAGDFILTEAYRFNNPGALRDAYISSYSFLFQDFKMPVMKSEFILLQQPGTHASVVGNRIGELDHRQITLGAWRGDRWSFTADQWPVVEPLMPPAWLVLPNLRINYNITWPDVADLIRSQLIGKLALPTAARTHFRDITAGLQASEAVPAVHRWISQHIDHEPDDTLSLSETSNAEGIFLLRKGSRTLLLLAALESLGLDYAFCLGQEAVATGLYEDVPSLDAYAYPLIKFSAGGAERWLAPEEDYAQVGYLPPAYHGGSALNLGRIVGDRGGNVISLPTQRQPADQEQLVLRGVISPDGALAANVELTMPLEESGSTRAALAEFSPAQLQQFLSALPGSIHPGAVPETGSLVNALEADKPLSIQLAYTVTNFAPSSKQGHSLLRALPTSGYLAALASASTRVHPLALANGIDERRLLIYQVPQNGTVVDLPPPVEVQTDFGGFTLSCSLDDSAVVITESIWIPAQRIEPGRYPAFRKLLSQLDDAERMAGRMRIVQN